MIVGDARVSTDDHDLSLQLDALQAANCEKVFRDAISGAKTERPGLTTAFEHVRNGDMLVVWQLNRLGRSLSHLIKLIQTLEGHGVGFKSLTEQIDTTTSGGKLIFHIFGALAEFERSLIRKRTMAGLQAARARGRKGGRPRKPNTDTKIVMAKRLHADPNNSIAEICQTLGVSRATLNRNLAAGEPGSSGEV